MPILIGYWLNKAIFSNNARIDFEFEKIGV